MLFVIRGVAGYRLWSERVPKSHGNFLYEIVKQKSKTKIKKIEWRVRELENERVRESEN